MNHQELSWELTEHHGVEQGRCSVGKMLFSLAESSLVRWDRLAAPWGSYFYLLNTLPGFNEGFTWIKTPFYARPVRDCCVLQNEPFPAVSWVSDSCVFVVTQLCVGTLGGGLRLLLLGYQLPYELHGERFISAALVLGLSFSEIILFNCRCTHVLPCALQTCCW